MGQNLAGAFDIVANLYTAREIGEGRTGLDSAFADKVRMSDDMRRGVSVDEYLAKMDTAGIERSFLVAVRAGDHRRSGSFEVTYERVAEVCAQHPDRFSGLAGIDTSRGMAQLRDLTRAVEEYGFVGAHWYPHWAMIAPDAPQIYPVYAKCCELDVPIMLQVGQNLIYSDTSRLPSVARPILLDQVAIDFPELRLIGMHIGTPWAEEMIAMAWKHANVFIGADAYAPRHWPASLVHYINTYGREKVLFGSGWPVIDPVRAVAEVGQLGLRPESQARLMRHNASRVFNLA